VINAIRRLHDRSSSADPVPTTVLKQIADIIAPFIAELFNCSLHKFFPAQFRWKIAQFATFVRPQGTKVTN